MQKQDSSSRIKAAGRTKLLAVLTLTGCAALLGIGVAAAETFINGSAGSGLSPAAANAFQSKLMELSATRSARPGSLTPVVITDAEVNSFIKYDRPQFLPPAVRDLEIHFKPEGIYGAANVNFDELKPTERLGDQLGARLLAAIFRGTQRVTALGVVQSSNGTGTVTIKDVHIGDTALSDWLVNWFIQNYLQSEYKIDLSKPFLLPNHVTHIEFAPGKATFVRGTGHTKQQASR